MRQEVHAAVLVMFLIAGAALLGGCQSDHSDPNYGRPLPPGKSALRKLLSLDEWPDLRGPYSEQDEQLAKALDRSYRWFQRPSSKEFFPIYDVTHSRAKASVYAFRKILQNSGTPMDFEQAIQKQFDCYTSVGYNDNGTVLFTGYYTPIFDASLEQTEAYQYPLYKKPDDLVIDPLTGEVKGREVDGGFEQYPSRREIEQSNMLEGKELVYVSSRFDQYVIHVNGSAKLNLRNGDVMHIGYAGNNGHEYTGLGQTLIEEGVFSEEDLSLPALREYFRDKPDELERYVNMNDRFVFFSEYEGDRWPAGSIGVKVTPKRTLATDNDVFPRASVVVVNTQIPTANGSQQPFNQIMLDQDTGGAIRAAGRADIYMGIGPSAATLAGTQFAEGRMYYFFLKHDRVLEWIKRMRQAESEEVASADG
jgi:membrane-bound lytic murein transglycosylase A